MKVPNYFDIILTIFPLPLRFPRSLYYINVVLGTSSGRRTKLKKQNVFAYSCERFFVFFLWCWSGVKEREKPPQRKYNFLTNKMKIK